MKTSRLLFKPLRGIDDSWRPSQNPPKALRIRDMRFNDKDAWENSGGYKVLIPDDEEGAAWTDFNEIESVHWFSEHSGNRQHLIFEAKNATDMRLYLFDGSKAGAQKWRPMMMSDGIQAPSRSSLDAPHLRTVSVAMNGRIYLFNGRDPALVFNGRYTERAGFDGAPSAPTGQALRKGKTGIAELGLGRKAASGMSVKKDDPIRKWGYRYKVTFINERGQESPPSSPSTMITGTNDVNGQRKMAIVTIPRGGENIVARRIYRTRQCLDTNADLLSRAIGSNFYFHAEISNNFQTTFEDAKQDAFLGPLLDEDDFGPWPARATMGASFKNRLFLAGSNSSDVQFSAQLRPEVFPVDNILSFGQDDCGPITGLYTTQNALLVFKQRGIFLIKSQQTQTGTTFFSQNISKDIGCIAPNSIAEVPGVGILFLSMEGVYGIEGSLENVGSRTQLIRYSTPIPGLTNRINNAASIQAVGNYYPKDKEYWLAVPVDGSDKNNFVLVYHGAIGSWSFREDFPIADAIVTQDHRGYYIFGSNDSSNKGLHVYTRGASTKGTASIEPLWETTDIDFNGPFAAFNPKYVVCDVIGYGDNDFELTYRVNRNLTAVESAKAQDQQDYTNQYAVYDTATWSTSSLWYEHRPVPIRFDITTAGQPACRELRLTFESSGRRLQILSFAIGVVSGAPYEKMIPISSVVEEQRG
jgi:hypothetical protein